MFNARFTRLDITDIAILAELACSWLNKTKKDSMNIAPVEALPTPLRA